MCRCFILLAAICCSWLIQSTYGLQAPHGSCNYGCGKNRLTTMDPDSPLVREAQVQSIKMKILMRLGLKQAPNITMSPERRSKILDLLSDEMNNETDESHTISNDELKLEEKSKSTALFAEEDLSCPPDSHEDALICLRFQILKDIQNRVIAKAEVGFSFSAGRNSSFQVQELRTDGLERDGDLTLFHGAVKGDWVRFDITNLTHRWAHEASLSQQRQPAVKVLQVICRSCSSLKPADVARLLDAEQSRPFIIIKMDQLRARQRSRRSVDCDLRSDSPGCCRYPFEVDFHHIGWDWIILPKSYKPNFCRGTCNLEVNLQRQHSIVMGAYMKHYPTMARKIELSMCCTGVKMSSLNIAYSVDGKNVHQSTLDNMIVDECHCA